MLTIPFRRETEAWAEGRNPYPRAPLLVVFLFILWGYLGDRSHSSIFDGLNLVVHEAGHLAFSYFGEFLAMAGGTIFELAVPLGVGIAFYRQRDFFALAVVLFWLGTACFDIGVYAADARARALPLVSTGFGEPLHDWYYLLARTGLLRQDQFIGGGFRLAGILAMGFGILWGGWMLHLMRKGAAEG